MLKVKVCGMRDVENINRIVQLKPDYIGFIFYEKSPRFFHYQKMNLFDEKIQKTGVFVNESFQMIQQKIKTFALNCVQLHGAETPDLCSKINTIGVTVIKSFAIKEGFDWKQLKIYESVCDYFLFDTYDKLHGGTGKIFNWELLNNYEGKLPFLLSGGIGLHNIDRVLKIKHPRMIGIDINSRIEDSPGIKNVNAVQEIIKKVRGYNKIKRYQEIV